MSDLQTMTYEVGDRIARIVCGTIGGNLRRFEDSCQAGLQRDRGAAFGHEADRDMCR
jgi:hypothetical protein